MDAVINTPHTVYPTVAAAEFAAAAIFDDDDEYTYTISKNPKGVTAIIKLFHADDGSFFRNF